jgi:hypothetical protein
MSVGNVFFKIGHSVVTCLLFAAGLFFDALTLICLAPIFIPILPNILPRWAASLSCLALSIVFLAGAFSRWL